MPLKRRRQKMFDSVTERIKNQTQGGLKVNPETGVRYEEPLEEKHPLLTVGVMAAQPGTIVEKALAPMVYKGMIQSAAEGNLSEALMAGMTPVKVNPYTISNLGGGYMLKSLMRGSPLEKQLSAQGTININNIKALAGKGSKVEQSIIDRVLAEQFAGQKTIDYDTFRKAVQDKLIAYKVRPSRKFNDYGIDGLGFNKTKGLQLKTNTFYSPKIKQGNDAHYYKNTLGHSRTYTTKDEPDVLHVMESQSDWAQRAKESLPATEQEKYLQQNYPIRQIQENLKFASKRGQTKMRYPTRETASKIEGYGDLVNQPDIIVTKWIDSNGNVFDTNRIIDQNLWNEYNKLQNELYDALDRNSLFRLFNRKRINKLETETENAWKSFTNSSRINPELSEIQVTEPSSLKLRVEPILKRYEEFPKQYKKLFKDSQVRTVTDPRGNTWYEVDVPENYLKMEWQYKQGGKLKRK